MTILQEEDSLMEIVQLVGSDSLPENQQLTLEVARLIREELLQQNAFHEVDKFCKLEKAKDLIDLVFTFEQEATLALENSVPIGDIIASKAKYNIATTKLDENYKPVYESTKKEIKKEMEGLIKKYK